MNMKMKKMFSMFLAMLMVCSVVWTNYTPMIAEAATTQTTVASSNQYGLQDNVQDGVILHAWQWSFNNIKANMKKIAEAGYTAVQTSVIQQAKEGTKGKTNEVWWVFYQPANFTIDNTGNSALGTKAEFKAMCDEAHKYGIKVIVDVVANHLGNNMGYDLSSAIPDDIRNDSSCWHETWNQDINSLGGYDNRWAGTQGSMSGLPDLNTGNTKIQNYVLNFLKECIDSGADGFRFDAAKHIELPTDSGFGSQFWPTVINGAKSYYKTNGYYKNTTDLYCYGEILDSSATSNINNYTQYMSITDNKFGNDTRNGMNAKDANWVKGAMVQMHKEGAAANKCVLWAESHDTYSNKEKVSTDVSDSDINKTWALVASTNDATSLYFTRTQGYRGGTIGEIYSTQCFNKEVVEVNKFHNYFAAQGMTDYVSSSNNIVYNERGTSGVVLVNVTGGSDTVNVKANRMKDGTYKDQVSGNTFTVSNGQISGQIGSTGIAVVYNPTPISVEPYPTISEEGGNFSTDTLTLTLGLINATSGTYKIDNEAAKTYTSSTQVTIGAGMEYGESVTVTLTATDGVKTSDPVTYTFTKTEPANNVAYLDLPSGWSTPVYCYAYDSATETVNNGEWPGVQMTLDSETGYYKYEIPENIVKPRVIFYSSDTNRTPVDMEPGYLFETDGSWVYSNGEWKTLPINKGKVIVKYVDETGNEIASSKTMTGTVGSTYTTTALEIDGYTLKTTPANASGTYTKSDITVTYVYKEATSEPKVTTSLADGSTFTSETQTITLTLKNAVSGTYSVDNGPVKTFTNTASVVLGQGKVADSTVTVKATAKASDGTTKSFTFNYNKKFNGTVNEEATAAKTAAYSAKTSSQGLASQYSTNKAGVGVKKTISVDGDLSDWDSSMMIAQGAANDDPRVYRENSMYEVPIDLYALYGAYDDNNLYLMWEMTNVQDVVAPNDNYPLSQGILWQTQELPFFIAVDTGDTSTAIGNDAKLQTAGTIWNSGMTISSSFNKLISINTKGGNGPFVYGGDSTGLNPVEELDATTSKIKMDYGLGILSKSVKGIDKAYGAYNNRLVGDVCNDSAAWVDFNTLGHSSSTMDFFYELSIPFDELGVTKSEVEQRGLGVLLVATMGKSGMDCLPYDVAMNDNADQADTESQEFNSFEKSDEDYITCEFANVGSDVPPTDMELNFGADRSAPQTAGTALTLNGIAQGGTGPYTYEYYVNNSLVATKSGSGATSTSWTPSEAGTYMIKCVVTDSTGLSATSAKRYTVEEGEDDVLTAALTANGTTGPITCSVGSSIKLDASASGGAGNYTYKFVVHNLDTNAWFTLRDYGSSASYTTKLSSAGNKEFVVSVKDGNGTIVSTNKIQVTAASGALTGSLKANGSTANISTSVGSSIKLDASASGGAGNYTYKFVVHNLDTNAWFTLRDYGSSASYTTKLSSAGNKEFVVSVKDGNGTIVTTNKIRVTASASGALTGSLKVNGSTANINTSIGSSIKLDASASGGAGNYTYKFVVHNLDTNSWFTLRDYGSSASYTTKLSSAGNKEFVVSVKDGNGTIVTTNRIRVTASGVLTGTLKVNGSEASISCKTGSDIKLDASALGGAGNYTYKFVLHMIDSDTWITLSDYSDVNTYTIALGVTGKVEFVASIKDANGTIAATKRVQVVLTA